MYEPRAIKPDLDGDDRALDRLSESVPGLASRVLFECDTDGALIDANSRYYDIEFGAGLAPGQLARTLVAALAPGDRSIAATFALELLGEPRHFHVRFVPVSTHGRNKLKFAGMMREVGSSADEAANDVPSGWHGADLLRVNSDWYWETDARGLLTSVSRSLELLLGRPEGGLLGRPLSDVGVLLRGENGEMPYDLARQRGSNFRDQLMSIAVPGSGTRLYRLAGVTVADGAGGLGYRGVAAVVPNSARLIERMRSELGKSAKQQFLAAMSHELRTPLNAIIGFAEAMAHEVHGPLKPQYVDYAGDIADAGRHLLGLIQDILDISSLDAGGIALDIDRFDLRTVVDQARTMITIKADARAIDTRGVELAYPVTVHADRRRTLQILVNLLTNAVKFTPEGGMVGAMLDHCDDPAFVALTVWDTGPGIDPANHARIFDKFEQVADQPHVAHGEGVGLGLHIARRLATAMGGDLTLDSRLGEGARFTLRLPAG
jgi:signal transduction histidine kinase